MKIILVNTIFIDFVATRGQIFSRDFPNNTTKKVCEILVGQLRTQVVAVVWTMVDNSTPLLSEVFPEIHHRFPHPSSLESAYYPSHILTRQRSLID